MNTEQEKLIKELATDGEWLYRDRIKDAEPLLKYLREKHHPHTTAIVTGNSIELVEGVKIKSNS